MSGEMCVVPANLYVRTLADAKGKIQSMDGNYNLFNYSTHLSYSTIVDDKQNRFAGMINTYPKFNYNYFEQGNEAYLQTCANPSGCNVQCMDINGDGNFDTCMETRPNGDTVINDEQGELIVRECSTNPNITIGRFYGNVPNPGPVFGQLSSKKTIK